MADDGSWLAGRDPVTGALTEHHRLAARCENCGHPWLSHVYPEVGLGCPPWKYAAAEQVVDGIDYGYPVTPGVPKNRSKPDDG